MEVRFNVTDDEFIRKLQDALKVKTAPEVVKEAMTILNWAVQEVSRGRVILSADINGQNLHRLVTPGLSNVRPLVPENA